MTTVLGLLPLLLETSFQARFLIPMAITIAGGLVSATAIVLVKVVQSARVKSKTNVQPTRGGHFRSVSR